MKLRIFSLLVILSLLLSGCGAAVRSLDAAEERMEQKIDAVEDRPAAALHLLLHPRLRQCPVW